MRYNTFQLNVGPNCARKFEEIVDVGGSIRQDRTLSFKQ